MPGADRHQPPHRHVREPNRGGLQQPAGVAIDPLLVIDGHDHAITRQTAQRRHRRPLQQRLPQRHFRDRQAQGGPQGTGLRRGQPRQHPPGDRIEQVGQIRERGLPARHARRAQHHHARRLRVGRRPPHTRLADPRRPGDHRRGRAVTGVRRQHPPAGRQLRQPTEQPHQASVTTGPVKPSLSGPVPERYATVTGSPQTVETPRKALLPRPERTGQQGLRGSFQESLPARAVSPGPTSPRWRRVVTPEVCYRR